ncbi:MAG: tyrosine-type recombinase/integrase [Desulfobacterales bacterium]|jgi:integrase
MKTNLKNFSSTSVNSNNKGKETRGVPKFVLQSGSPYDNPKGRLNSEGGLCMKGSIFPQKDRGRWAVNWYCSLNKRSFVITRYRNHFMPISCYKLSPNNTVIFDDKGYPIPDKEKCQGHKTALKLLNSMQGRWEQHSQGICQFRIEEFTGKGWTDILEFFEQWMKDHIEKKRKPATINGYWSYYKNWIMPFFEQNPVMLHEIRASTLNKLLNYIRDGLDEKNPNGNTGKTAQNIMYTLHSMMDYALRDERITVIPPFPKEEDYNIIEPIPQWLNTREFWEVLNKIPYEHRPIFLWMYYHLMREAEACAIQWEDWDEINQVFWVCRSISARKVVQSTKTGEIYPTPCHRDFYPYMLELKKSNGRLKSKYIFTNSRARRSSKRYTNESINNIWKKACKQVGISIRPYAGTRHSRASQMHNELGMSLPDIQDAGSWKRLESVKRYAKTELSRKKELLERNLGQKGDRYYKTTTERK